MNKKTLYVLGVMLFFVGAVLHIESRTASAKGLVGEYNSVVNDGTTYLNPNNGKVLDSTGTVWNLVDDVYLRSVKRTEKVTPSFRVAATTSQANNFTLLASSQTINFNQHNWGWALAIPTATVNYDRIKISLYNPKTNTQQMLVHFSTGFALAGPLSYPTTDYGLRILEPDESWEVEVSSFVHPVVKATGSISSEYFISQEWR